MDKPNFDRFHPNSDACRNACDAADEGDFEKACSWLTSDCQNGLEYDELLEDYKNAHKYVQHKAEEVGVTVSKGQEPYHDYWKVGN